MNLAVHIHPQIVTCSLGSLLADLNLQFTSIRRLLPPGARPVCSDGGLQFTSIRRLLLDKRESGLVDESCSSHPSADCYWVFRHQYQGYLSCSSHPSADCYYRRDKKSSIILLAVHIHPQIVTRPFPAT